MLYVTKAKKFGMTAIMGFLIGLIMVFFGNGYLTMVTGLVGGLLADVILKKADYKRDVYKRQVYVDYEGMEENPSNYYDIMRCV